MKKTPWFPCSTPPVRPGLYEIRWSDAACYGEIRVWCGNHWAFDNGDWTIFGNSGMHSMSHQWRGILKEDK